MSESAGVYSKSVQGGKWQFITTIIQKLLNVVTFFILARLLTPRDYGVIAVVFLVIGFFETVTTPGFEKALLQRQGDVEEYIDTTWTFRLIKSVVLAALIFLLAPVIAYFFHITDYTSTVRWSAAFVLIGALSNSRELYFFRNLDFKKLFIRDISTQIAYVIVAIGWAVWVEASVSALLAGQLARYFCGLIISYVLYPQAHRLSFAFGKLKHLWHYSRWVIFQNILGYVLGILDSVYVGHFLDPARLGLYTKARDLAYAPVSPFTNAIIRVGFPAYAQVQDKLEKLQQGFMRSIDVVLTLTLPLALLLWAEGGPIVQLLLGKTWLGIVLPLKLFSIAIIFSTLAAIMKPIFDGVGRPEIAAQLNVGQLIFSLVFIYFGVKWGGVSGVAFATILIGALNLMYAMWQVRRVLQLNWAIVSSSLAPIFFSIVITLIIAVPLYLFGFGHSQNNIVITFGIVFCSAIYIASIWLAGNIFKAGPLSTFLSILREVRSRPAMN